MAWNIRECKTEHAGAKHGNGAFWGRKWIAKHASNNERRRNARRIVAVAVEEMDHADIASGINQPLHGARRRRRRNTRRWCAGKVGRPHDFALQETLEVDLGLPPLHVSACACCGRKSHNLKLRRKG